MARAALLAVPVVLLLVGGWVYRWTVDDGFIYYRVVDQITSGNGPVFNVGERVEAFTSPIWTALLVAGELLVPARLEWIGVVLGLLLSAGGLALAIAGSRRLVRSYEPDAVLIPAGALVPAAILVAWIFATSGMEQGLVVAWLGASLAVLARWALSEGPLSAAGAVMIGLGWLVRPELALYSAFFVVLVAAMQWSGDGWRERVRLLAAAGALPVLYQGFRMAYYGALVSNPAVAKDAFDTRWSHGWSYLVDLVAPYWLWLPLGALVVGAYIPLLLGLRRSRHARGVAVVAAFGLGALLNATYIIAMGGDWLHGRLLLPALYAAALPVAVVPFTRAHIAALLVPPWAIGAALLLRPPQLDPDYPIVERFILAWPGNRVTLEDRGWGVDRPQPGWYRGDDRLYFATGLAVSFDPIPMGQRRERYEGPIAALGSLGAGGYWLGPDWQIVDLLGLSDPIGARLTSTPTRIIFERKPGHEKPLPVAWIVAMLTPDGTRVDGSQFPEDPNPLIPRPTGEAFHEQVAWARAALRCPAIEELRDAAMAPLTPGRVMRNVLGSVARTRIRIPPEPREAYRAHCGPGLPPEVQAVRSELTTGLDR